MPQPSVVILGAGLAGLTLGRCLRQKGIAATIYESADAARFSERHAYGIWLQPWAYKPLLEALDIEESSFRERVAIDGRRGLNPTWKHAPSPATPFRACRNKLETFLRDDQAIRFNSKFGSATFLESNGGIEISFTDESELQSALTVDSLGVHSQLRKSLLPRIRHELQPFAVYNGKRSIAPDLFSSLYAPFFRESNVLVRMPVRPGDPRLEISVNNYQSDGNVSISYTYSRPAKTHSHGDDPVFNCDRSKSGAAIIPEEFYKELANFIEANELSAPFRDSFVLERVRMDRVLHWLMRSVMVPRQDLLRLRVYGVTMIGDSAHAVPILGGHGGNLAILDAVRLSEILASKLGLNTLRPDDWTKPSNDEFYQAEWHHWYEAVEEVKPDLAKMYNTQWDDWNNAVTKSNQELADIHEPSSSATGSILSSKGL